MKKVYSILLSVFLLLFINGCGKTATDAVKEYLDSYKNLDSKVLANMNEIIDSENLSETNSKLYEDIFKKQYMDLTYDVQNEEYNGDEATISVKIKVYDLFKSQNESTNYLANNSDKFLDENGHYDSEKYISYKLNKMKETTDKVEYTIDFYVVNTKDGWVVSALSNSDLEKIHGIYDYES